MKRPNRKNIALCGVLVMTALALEFSGLRADAQSTTTGTIAGSVKDPSGAAMPGVTVEASSPALIEKVRQVVTDDHGQYKIVDLRPGVYTVTFSAPGFATTKRPDLELNTGVALPVDVSMTVSSTGETVTVTGATPVVDVQNTSPQNVLTSKELDAVPTGGSIPGYAELTLGTTLSGPPDVGGNQGEENVSIVVHDSRTNNADALWDGMSFANGVTTGGVGQRGWLADKISVQEVTVSKGTAGADAGHPGANLNYVPREGSDTLHGIFNLTGASSAWQSSNLDPYLMSRGLTSEAKINYTYDFGFGVGGPIVKGKLWFWAAFEDWAAQQRVPGNYFNATQNTLFYTPDLSRPAYNFPWNYVYDIHLNWQATKKDKFSGFESFEDRCACFQGVDTANRAPEASDDDWNRATFLTQVTWDREQTEKLLFHVGATAALAPGRVDAYSPGVKSTDVPIVLQNTGYGYHAFLGLSNTSYGKPIFNEYNGELHAIYVTGSHAIKAGFQWEWNNENYRENYNMVPNIGPVSYLFNQPAGAPQPVPVQLTEYAAPLNFTSRSWVNAFYVQDQWTIKRLTLNLGMRIDVERGYAPAQTEAATAFTPAHDFAAVNNIPDWNDIEPRIGADFDVFGNGKVAIKGALGRYVIGDYTSTTVALTPADAIVTSASRTWNDANGNYVPDCNLLSTAANGECGALSNNGFGGASTNTTYDPSILSGWQVRPYNWQADIQYQQQLRPGVGVTVGWYRTWYGNLTVTQNTAVPANQYGTFCITAPTDSRVSALNGGQICGFHDVNPAYFGKVQNYITKASDFGGQSETYNGFDFQVNARFGKNGRGLATGGFATGTTDYNDCAIATNYPNVTVAQTNSIATITSNTTTPAQFCHFQLPWRAQSQWKAAVTYPLPWYGIETALVFQNLGGFAFNSNYVATNAQISQSLGRNLSACGASTTCSTTETLTNALYSPFSQSESRLNQLDLRISKVVGIKRVSIKSNFDIYNSTNNNAIISESTTYSTSTSYLKPLTILGPRLYKLGFNINF